jgi:hypothetical protein
MLVSRLDDAAQVVAPDVEPKFYDDRGCLAADVDAGGTGAQLYVQLDGGTGWIEVDDAVFAFPAGFRTPMGYGVTAFRTAAEAAKADREGAARTWSEVVKEVRNR